MTLGLQLALLLWLVGSSNEVDIVIGEDNVSALLDYWICDQHD